MGIDQFIYLYGNSRSLLSYIVRGSYCGVGLRGVYVVAEQLRSRSGAVSTRGLGCAHVGRAGGSSFVNCIRSGVSSAVRYLGSGGRSRDSRSLVFLLGGTSVSTRIGAACLANRRGRVSSFTKVGGRRVCTMTMGSGVLLPA